jgi:thiol-disulfide isomerase/thioredoxin
LLDFWASWCVPCRQSLPHLKGVFRKYHSKGLEIIGVSTDFNRKAWISAVNHDSINIWHHVPVADKYAEGPSKITKDDIYENYFVQAIPLTILIDKNGKIIGRWLGSGTDNEKELDKKLAEIFTGNKK